MSCSLRKKDFIMSDEPIICTFCGFQVYGIRHMENHIESEHKDEYNLDKEEYLDGIEYDLDSE